MPQSSLVPRLVPARFAAFFATFAVSAALLCMWLSVEHAVLLAFDVGALVFLGLVAPLLKQGDAEQIRAHARDNDANRITLLVLTLAVTLVIMIAVGAMLRERTTLQLSGYAIVVGTLALLWLFSNSVYALHYAHLFYMDKQRRGSDDGGLDFPNTQEPDYWDFVYFSFTLGMTFQTSDVQITARSIRKVVTFHALAAFVFNIGVLAFSINVLGSKS